MPGESSDEDAKEKEFHELLSMREPLLRIAKRRAKTPEDAEDALQTAYLQTYLLKLKKDGVDYLKYYFYRILNTEVAGSHRTLKTVKLVKLNERMEQILPDAGEEPDHAVEQKQLGDLLGEGLSELSEMDKAIIVLRYLLGKSYKEIGVQLGITDGSARKRHFDIMGRLRKAVLSMV